MESLVPVISETEDFRMLPNGDILGVKAYGKLVGVKRRRVSGRRKSKDRVSAMRVGLILFRNDVLDF